MKKSTVKFKITVKAYCFFIALLSCFLATTAQTTDTIAPKEKNHPNVIKLNISAPFLYNSAVMGSYERVLSPHRSFTIYGGYCEFPSPSIISENNNLKIINNKQKSGFAIGADYRFYLAGENKYAAPRGIYLAPFVSYYSFTNTRNFQYTGDSLPQTVEGKLGVAFFNVGASLGYQFVIKNRFVIDMVLFGPSFTAYKFSAKVNGNISADNLTQAQQDILNALKDKFPFVKDLANNQEVSRTGIAQFGSIGFRYSISIGYRF
jgi:hypothetical protein